MELYLIFLLAFSWLPCRLAQYNVNVCGDISGQECYITSCGSYNCASGWTKKATERCSYYDGLVSCVRDCPAGTRSIKQSINDWDCIKCPAGYSSPARSNSCSKCEPGKYNPVSGGSCQNCPSGKIPNANSIECDNCPPGTYASFFNLGYCESGCQVCTQCPADTYSGSGASSCKDCDSGFEANPGSSTCTDIDECENPTLCPTNSVCQNTLGSFLCKCDEGYYVEGTQNEQSASVPMKCIEKRIMPSVSEIKSNSFKIFTANEAPVEIIRIQAKRVDPYDDDLREDIGRASIALRDIEPAKLKEYGLEYPNMKPGTKVALEFTAYNAEIEDKSFATSTIIQLSCSCPGKSSEAPSGFITEQKNGFVNFFFNDNSLCADTFVFKRFQVDETDTQISSKTPLASEYNIFKSGNDVCQNNALISPGREAQDSIAQSNLKVGKAYKYELSIKSSVTGITYNSPVLSTKHIIQWEASIAGVVTTNPENGAFPVENVNVECTLLGPNVRIATVTDEAGKYECFFRDDENKNNYGYNFMDDGEYGVNITFSKSTSTNTGEIQHNFLCRGGVQDCTNEPLRVNLKHLEFNKPVIAYDDSALPMNGKVSVAGTEGCPLSNVQICLTQYVGKTTQDTPVCTETNSLGEYTILASIHTRVGLRATYNQHELVPVGNTIWVDQGIEILEGMEFEGFDFEDVTKANMTVEVGGGLCNINLGKSTLELKLQGCTTYSKELKHDGFRNQFEVPAQELQLQITDIRKENDDQRSAMVDYFNGEQRYIDLTDVSQQVENEDEEQIVLFQYEGVAKILPEFYKVNPSTRIAEPPVEGVCNPGDLPYDALQEVRDDLYKSYSFHLLDDKSYLFLSAEIKMYMDDDLQLCDRLPEGTNFTVVNQLGYSDGTRESDIEALESELELDFAPTIVSVLGRCNTGCDLAVLPKDESRLKQNSRIEFDFLTGYPNFFEPYTRQLTITTQGLYYPVQHTCEVVVEGSKLLENFGSFAVPTNNPIMVLRDPPGSHSYSYYKNVETKIELKSEHYDKSRKWNVDVLAGFAGESENTIGLGANFQIAKVEAAVGYRHKTMKSTMEEYNDNIYRGKLSTTWSYQTSRDIWTAGRSSDIFVVPSLNIVFNENREVKWNMDACHAVDKTQTEFDFKDTDSNKEVFSFLSYYFVTQEEIPRLERIIAEKIAVNTSEFTDFERNEHQLAINILQDSLDKWKEEVNKHNDVSLAAKNRDMSKLLGASTYVEEKVVEELPGKVKEKFKGYTRPFAPKTLTSEVNDLEKYHSFKFDGGGSLLKYELSHEAAVRISSRDGSDDDNTDVSKSNGFSLSYKAAIGGVASLGKPIVLGAALATSITEVIALGAVAYTLRFGSGIGIGRRLENETNQEIDEVELSRRRELFQFGLDYLNIKVTHKLKLAEESDSTESTIGFTLGDDDSGDYFDVDVFIDKTYGSFVFHTVSGESKCPVEPGTTPREVPYMRISKYPSAPVLPDEKMMFKIFLQNQGTDLTSLQLYQDLRTNRDGLSISANSRSLDKIIPIEKILAGEGYEALLTVSRGPVLYEYPAVTLLFRSTCEYTRNIGDGNLIALSDGESSLMSLTLSNALDSEGQPIIKFERPCPEIIWSDSLEATRMDGKGFILNVDTYTDVFEIVIRNPNRNLYKLADVNRLEEIKVWYRRLGVGDWTRAEDPMGNLIDIKNQEEDAFGYIKVDWDIKSLFDGQYEVYVECNCEKIFGFPESFEKASTKRLTIIQDMERPQLYGWPTPFEVITMNSPVTFVFSEPIQCLKPFNFKVRAIIEGSNTFYDEDNLDVICEGRTVRVSFQKTFRWELVMGKNLMVTIQDVMDLNNNALQESVSHQIRFPSVTTDSVVIQLSLRIQTDCLNITAETNNRQTLANEVAELLQLDVSRVDVSGVLCERPGLLVAKVTISPSADTTDEGGRRILNRNNDPSVILDTLREELDKISQENSLLANATFDNDSVVITTEDAASGTQGASQIVYIPESPEMKRLDSFEAKLDTNTKDTQESLEMLRRKLEANEATNGRLESILIGLSVSLFAVFVGGLVVFAKMKHPNLREERRNLNPLYEQRP